MCHAWRVSGDWELLACFTRLGTAGVFHEASARNCWRVSRGWKLLACFTRLGTAGVFHETGNCWPACFTRLGTAGVFHEAGKDYTDSLICPRAGFAPNLAEGMHLK